MELVAIYISQFHLGDESSVPVHEHLNFITFAFNVLLKCGRKNVYGSVYHHLLI